MIGEDVGHYRILAKLGEGGMGEVYRAHDTKLGRDVAIKVLPDAFAADAERLARFRREAQVLASLNHPNIGHIYGLEGDTIHALVLELVEGPTLAERIAHGPMAPADAVPIARQVAEALEAAHDAGVVHRDLKPANIKVRDDGTVKVLDFGLAKATANEASAASMENSPTLTARATQMGTILGTAAYMSPEQAKGRAIDKRADIWAFGAVLYEMLSGRRAFEGEDISDTLAAVLRQDVNWSALPAATPGALRELLARCLERDVKRRLRDIGEARLVLETPAAVADSRAAALKSTAPAPVTPPKGFGIVHAIAGLLLVGLAVMSWLWWRAVTIAQPPVTRVSVTLPAEVTIPLIIHPSIAVSDDGSKIAFVGNHKGVDQLYVRPIAEFEPRPVAGTEGASSPFFSPDGAWIGFFATAELKKVAAEGGPVITITGGITDERGAIWSADDTIIYSPGPATAILRVSAAGGTAVAASTIDEAKHERTHRYPEILPDGKTVLVTVGSVEHPDDYDDATIEAIRLDTGARSTVLKGGRAARYVSTGHLLFLRGKVLYAVSFDPGTLAVRGTPVPVIDGISGDVTTGSANYGVSKNGTLAFVPGDPTGGNRQLVWVDKQGKATPVDTPAAHFGDPQIAPDGRRVAVADTAGASVRDIYIIDTVVGTSSRLTFGDVENRTPHWTHDGRRIVYVAYDRTKNVSAIMIKNADGTNEAQKVTEVTGQAYAEDLTSDDSTLIFSANSSTARGKFDILQVALQPGAKPVVEVSSPTRDAQNGVLSPDGKWLAYYTGESGRPEVYVQSFASKSSRAQVSTAGGYEPRWAPDGTALYFQQADGLIRVPITPGPVFTRGKGQMLFSGAILPPVSDSGQTYAVDPKGDRFLMLRPVSDPSNLGGVRVIFNWFDELRRLGRGR
ncbi:MAG TPA: protein kinase [Vicinamibacterales bacterium]|nr:protein kinase [Vicinamibacterales bacterium]